MVAAGDKGFIIEGADGLPVFFPFGAEVNPCGTDPEMLITVSGAVTATVNWCGETWNLPGDSAVEKSVCPTAYTKTKSTYYDTFYTTVKYWREFERWNKTGTTGLDIGANYNVRYRPLSPTASRYQRTASNYRNIRVISFTDKVIWSLGLNSARPVPPFTIVANPIDMKILATTTVTGATTGQLNTTCYYSTAGLSQKQYENSHTSGGITYSWKQGLGWT